MKQKPWAYRVRLVARRWWTRLRFGVITQHIKAVDGGLASEIEYRGRRSRVVGYWAYGSFDPSYPYRGE